MPVARYESVTDDVLRAYKCQKHLGSLELSLNAYCLWIAMQMPTPFGSKDLFQMVSLFWVLVTKQTQKEQLLSAGHSIVIFGYTNTEGQRKE